MKNSLKNHNGSVIKKHLKARKYKRWSKQTFMIIKVNLYRHEIGSILTCWPTLGCL